MNKIGVLFKPREGSRSVLNGSINLLGQQIRFGVFKNDRKEKDNHPDYVMLRYPDDDKPRQQRDNTPPPNEDDLPY